MEICDTTSVTYSATIVPIILQNCSICHGGDAPISGIQLEEYANIKVFAESGRLVGALRHLPGFTPMPKDRAPLPECQIRKIEMWVLDGAPNN